MRVSYLEIYNENVRDLLGKDQNAKLEVCGPKVCYLQKHYSVYTFNLIFIIYNHSSVHIPSILFITYDFSNGFR